MRQSFKYDSDERTLDVHTIIDSIERLGEEASALAVLEDLQSAGYSTLEIQRELQSALDKKILDLGSKMHLVVVRKSKVAA